MTIAKLGLFAAATLLTALVVVFLFGFLYPPSLDFPQHVAQLSAWVHYADPRYGFAPQFEINYRTPYLLSYLVARPFVSTLGLIAALKVVFLLAAVANVVALAALLRAVRQDVWLCLLGFPLTFGFVFYAGFMNFLLALPLVIATITLSVHYAQHARGSRGAALALTLVTTLACHALSFVIAALVSFIVYFGDSDRYARRNLKRAWPFILPMLVAAPWLLHYGTSGETSKTPLRWMLSWLRVVHFPTLLLGVGAADPLAIGFGLAVLATVAGALGRPAWSWHRSSLYCVAVLGYMLVPFQLLGVALVYPRFVALVIPGAILNSAPTDPLLSVTWRRALIVGLSVAWLSILIARADAFNAEARDFDRAVAGLSGCGRVRPLILDNETRVIPDSPLYVHFPAYYQAMHGGFLGFSFARYSIVLMRYRPGVDIGMAEDAEWNRVPFEPERELANYDCIIVRDKPSDREPAVFRPAALHARVELTAHAGQWWIYKTRSAGRAD
jgi:hypothetical protein